MVAVLGGLGQACTAESWFVLLHRQLRRVPRSLVGITIMGGLAAVGNRFAVTFRLQLRDYCSARSGRA